VVIFRYADDGIVLQAARNQLILLMSHRRSFAARCLICLATI